MLDCPRIFVDHLLVVIRTSICIVVLRYVCVVSDVVNRQISTIKTCMHRPAAWVLVLDIGIAYLGSISSMCIAWSSGI